MIKKLILIAVSSMFIVSYPVMANWELYTESSYGEVYVDISTIRKTGEAVKIWTLTNFKVPQNTIGSSLEHMSTRDLEEYQCEEETMRTISAVGTTGQMGSGEITFSENAKIIEWTPIVPRSVGASIMHLVCGKD
jgi:hypothetical protein